MITKGVQILVSGEESQAQLFSGKLPYKYRQPQEDLWTGRI